jgi:hypothetical protein
MWLSTTNNQGRPCHQLSCSTLFTLATGEQILGLFDLSVSPLNQKVFLTFSFMNHLHNESEAVRRPAVSAFQRPLHLLQGGQYTLQLAVHQARQGTGHTLSSTGCSCSVLTSF